VLTWLSRLAQESTNGGTGLAQPVGGMGGLTAALARAATAAGVELRLGAAVTRVVVDNDRACGVELATGERIAARAVISNADPKTTFLNLLGTAHLDTGFVRKISHLRARGVVAKLHLALDRLPAFTGLAQSALRGRLVVSPSLDYLERAFDAAKYGEFSTEPALEITVPTLSDDSLAPSGQHVVSVVAECAPHDLRGGWDGARSQYQDLLVGHLERFAPGLRQSIVGSELFTPVDIAARFGNVGGHWHHAELAFDQFYFVRPAPGAAQYSTPVAGLYLCGAGSHPGGGVAGMAGRLAAQVVLGKAG
jgi:phytoene dehydrogenase-like protein